MGCEWPWGMGAGVVWSLASLAAREGAEEVVVVVERREDRLRKSVTRKDVLGDSENWPQPKELGHRFGTAE